MGLEHVFRQLDLGPANALLVLGALPHLPDIGADELAAACDVPRQQAEHDLKSLADVRLLECDGPYPANRRYRMSEEVYAGARHCAKQVDTAQRRAQAVDRLTDHFLTWATVAKKLTCPGHDILHPERQPSTAPPYPSERPDRAFAWLRDRQHQLMASVQTAYAAHRYAAACQLVDAQWPRFTRHRHTKAWIEAYETYGLPAAQRWGDQHAVRRMLTSLGAGLHADRQYASALERFAQARHSAEHDSHQLDKAEALTGLGHTFLTMGDLAAAEPLLESALELVDTSEHAHAPALIRVRLGQLATLKDDREKAITLLSQAREILLTRGDPYDAARAMAHLGRAHSRQGNYATASRSFDDALEGFEATDSNYGQARVKEWMGDLFACQGRPGLARGWYQQSREQFELLGTSHDITRLDHRLGDLGRPDA